MAKTIKIIGLNPGTRYMGFAVLYGMDLRDWGVRNIEGSWSKDKLTKIMLILSSLFDTYEPKFLAIKKLNPSRGSPNLSQLVDRIKDIAKEKGMKIREYSLSQLKKFFQEEGRLKKKGLAQIIASQYPTLFYELRKEQNNMLPYYIRMFEAVALSIACFKQLNKHHAKS